MGKNQKAETRVEETGGVGELATGDTEQTNTNASPDEQRAADIPTPEAAIGTDAPATQEPAGEQVTESAEVQDTPAPETVVDVTEGRVFPLTRGRVVYYTAGADDRSFYGQGPMTAHVVEVYGDRKVNLLVAHPLHGDFQRRNDVIFRQPDDATPDLSYAEWMPFQVAQADRS